MTGKVDRLIAGFCFVSFGWEEELRPLNAVLVADGYLHEESNAGEEDDFDGLLAASSFGSEQALAIREQTPPAAREHARRVLDGKEKCATADVDDAVGGLVYGLAHGVVPGPTVWFLAGSGLTPEDLLTAWSGHDQASLKLVIFTCQTSMLWPDHRARLLQALIDHDAFDSLRHDVAWKIIDWTFDVPRPPRVLRQCAALAIEQVDFAAIAHTWRASARDEAVARACEPYVGDPRMPGDAALQDVHHQQETPPSRSTGGHRTSGRSTPALNPAPTRAALTAGPTRPAIAAQTDTPAKTRHSLRRARAHTRRLPPRPHTARRRPSTTAARKHRRAATPSARRLAIIAAAAVTVAVAVIALFLGALQPGNGSFAQPRLAGDPDSLRTAGLPSTVFFDPNSATLEPGADTVLQTIAQQTQSQDDLTVSITAYASPVGGTAADNLTLSAQRADVVRDGLIELGVPASQIIDVAGADATGPYLLNAQCQERKPDDATCPELRSAVIVLLPAADNP